MDFVKAATRSLRGGGIEVYPKFIVRPTTDLMIRGHDFYAIWLEKESRWSTNEYDAIKAIDDLLEEESTRIGCPNVAWLWDSDTKSINRWNEYCQKQQMESWRMLDSKILFADDEIKKEDYVTKRLPYSVAPGDTSSFDELLETLYNEDERHKILWMIGSILSGDSRTMDKFYVFYGAPGTGKSTILNIISKMFDGHCSAFSAKALGAKDNRFALEQFKNNPMIAIDQDANLSRIEDNATMNALISHEEVVVDEKGKSVYTATFQSTLICATNVPVKITDARSGLLRRLIDINPTGNKLSIVRYRKLMKEIAFEYGAIAQKCLDIYESNKHYYDQYESREMMALSNDMYDFMISHYAEFLNSDSTTLGYAYKSYVDYCTESNVLPIRKKDFKAELKSYFSRFYERKGDQWYLYEGFLSNKFDSSLETIKPDVPKDDVWLKFDCDSSLFDTELKDMPAQLATEDGTPRYKWKNVRTSLKDIDTSQLHYVKVPENHIVIDFDIPGPDGQKNLEINLAEANKFPPTYAELSKSGKGIHLHYIYNGDVSRLSRIYDDKIEIKVYTGDSSLRRKLTKCNDIPIKPISCALPLKEELRTLNTKTIENEKHLRAIIKKCLNKEYGATVCCVEFIKKLLDDAYAKEGLEYDVHELGPTIMAFALNSTHQAQKCLKLYQEMHLRSKNFEVPVDIQREPTEDSELPITFFDVEVFPNLFLICYKQAGENEKVHSMFNPTPDECREFARKRLVGFNNRKYDNHMVYARIMGYSPKQIHELSHRMIKDKSENSTFGPAYNLSYTDVYDFSSAGNKKSLKKWEIELGLPHLENEHDWDQDLDPKFWPELEEYCGNDVLATEKVFYHLKDDWLARQMLAKATGLSVNHTTNQLSAKLIFGNDQHPQNQFNWRHMGEVTPDATNAVTTKDGVFYHDMGDPDFVKFNGKGQPIFPGYEFGPGYSRYRGEDTGLGGYVYAEPGIYYNCAILDVASMHPSSAIAEELFGPKYTRMLGELKQARIFIKHKEFDKLSTVLEGTLAPFIEQCKADKSIAKGLSGALKTAINSVYGLTYTTFENRFRDPKNVDNIVAKRGALFMINLKHEVQKRGFTVAHIKTDSIKIPNATPEIIEFVVDFGKMYGYDFEHEGTYERICLVNNAVYIAKWASVAKCKELYGEAYVESSGDILKDNKEAEGDGTMWTATGAEFAEPYIFKRLFSGEEIKFDDYFTTKSVNDPWAIYLDKNENAVDDHAYQFVGKIGAFAPVLSGVGGGLLMKKGLDKNGKEKYDNVSGGTGFRWLEKEQIVEYGLQDKIDIGYFSGICNKAIEHINEFGDYYAFVD